MFPPFSTQNAATLEVAWLSGASKVSAFTSGRQAIARQCIAVVVVFLSNAGGKHFGCCASTRSQS